MSEQITSTEISRLLGALSDAHKGQLAAQLGRLMRRSGLSRGDLQIALALIDRLIADSVVSVRRALAEHIAESPLLPRSMIDRLLADVDSVALPIVRFSALLDDETLIAQLTRGEDFQLAVAGRETVSETVAGRLLEVGSEQAVAVLVRNAGAVLEEPGLDRAIDRFLASEAVIGAVAERPGLPLETAERLVSLAVGEQCIQSVSELMMQGLIKRHDLPQILAEDLIMHARERAVAAMVKGSDDIDQVRELAERMKAVGRLGTSLMLRALAGGDVQFFAAGMEALSGWPDYRVRGAIEGAGIEGFRRLYEESDLDPLLFHAFRVARDEVLAARRRQGGAEGANFIRGVVGRISEEYRNISPTGLEEVLARLRRRAETAGGPH